MNTILSVIFLVLSALLTRVFCVLAQNSRLMDRPNQRSLHCNPTVRGGGIVFIGLALLSIPMLSYFTKTFYSDLIILFISILLLALISFIDDLYNLSIKPRFLVHCFIALLIALFMRPAKLDFIMFSIVNPVFVSAFLFLAVIWAINHFNFMDGLDGFCGMQAVFLLAVYAYFFSIHHELIYQDFCLVLTFSLLGFLLFNFPPAKVFMGDIGSISLGLITFTIAVIAQLKYQVPILYWIILNGLFLFDSSVTLLRRILNKEKWYTPHKKHAYQRLKQFGLNSRLILLGQLVINGMFFLLILLFQQNKLNINLLFLLQLGGMVMLYFLIEYLFPMFQIEETLDNN